MSAQSVNKSAKPGVKPDRSAAVRAPDTTPVGRLHEGRLHGIMGYQLAQAAVTAHQVFMQHAGHPHDVRPVEFTILGLVCENPDVSATQLARALAVTPPNIKMWLDRMESRGLLQRLPSPKDRRAQHLRLTPAGQALAEQSMEQVAQGERQALEALSPGERTLLLELLHKIASLRRHHTP